MNTQTFSTPVPKSFRDYPQQNTQQSSRVNTRSEKPSSVPTIKYQIIVSDVMGFVQRLEPNKKVWIQADFFLYTGIKSHSLDPHLGSFDLQCLTLSLKSAVRAQKRIVRDYATFIPERTVLLIDHKFTQEELQTEAYAMFLRTIERSLELGFHIEYVDYKSPPRYSYESHCIQEWPDLNSLTDHTCTMYYNGESVETFTLSPKSPKAHSTVPSVTMPSVAPVEGHTEVLSESRPNTLVVKIPKLKRATKPTVTSSDIVTPTTVVPDLSSAFEE